MRSNCAHTSMTLRRLFVALPLFCMLLYASVLLFPSLSHARTVSIGYYQAQGFNDIETDGSYAGYGYDYLMEIAKYTGWNYHFVTMSPTKPGARLSRKEALALLKQDKVDFVGGISKETPIDDELSYPLFTSGTNYGVIAAAKGDGRFNSVNIDDLSNIRIGYCTNDLYAQEARTYFTKKKTYNVEFVPYSSVAELNDALQKRAVDLIYTNMLRGDPRQLPLMRLNAHPIYFVGNKNSNLVTDLDAALSHIESTRPEFSKILQKQYFTLTSNTSLALTPLELKYRSLAQTITVAINKNNYPFEYYDAKTHQAGGVTGALFKKLERTSGLRFVYLPCDSYAQQIEAVQKGHAQVISEFANDLQWADNNSMRITNEFMNLSISIIVNDGVKDALSPDNTVGVLRDSFIGAKLRKSNSYSKIKYYATPEALVDDIDDGHIQVGYLPTYSVNYLFSKSYYSRMRVRTSTRYSYDLGIGVGKAQDMRLYTILNKALDEIPNDDVNEILTHNFLNSHDKPTFALYFYKYPLAFIGILVAIFVIILGAVITLQRTQERRRREHYLNEQKLHLALAQTKIHVWDYDLRTNIIHLSEYEIESFFQLDSPDATPEELIDLGHVNPESARAFLQLFTDARNGSTITSALIKVRRRNKGVSSYYKWTRITLTLVYDDNDKIISAIGVSEDASQEVALQERASRDVLTKLLNRGSLRSEVEDFLKEQIAENSDDTHALFMVDVDDFKHVNDAYGHKRGDEVLIDVSKALTQSFRSDDIVARLGGDEFVVLMKNAGSPEAAKNRAHLLNQNLTLPYPDLTVTCSIGVYLIPRDTIDFDDLYVQADCAMYEAKALGKSHYVVRGNLHEDTSQQQ